MTRRIMRLTAEHVARVNRILPDPGPQAVPGHRHATDADFTDEVNRMLASRPPGPFWLFGYGSLIWRPETAFVEMRQALARGWHRRFCLGWDHRYRGSAETPGVMMALDRGGVCKGVAYRLPEDVLEEELHKLIRRELSQIPASFPWRWTKLITADGGQMQAMVFAMDRNSTRYLRLSEDEIVKVLSTASGFRGSMAEYLFSTVSKLEELGIHDRNLWRLQERVAARIEAAHPGDR